MKEEIRNNLDHPKELERLYRENKATFRKEFNLLFPEIQENPVARVWNERLNFEKEEISFGTSRDLIFVIIASFIAGLIAKIPDIAAINEKYFYTRNIGFIVLPLLITWFAWKQKLSPVKVLVLSAVVLASVFYINYLPGKFYSQTLALACIHLPLFLWFVLGIAFSGGNLKNHSSRLDFLRYNGDLLVMTTLIVLAGIIFTLISVGLFLLIDAGIEEFYFRYVIIWGLAASPIVGTYLVQANPQLVSKVSPVIAKIFTPLVLITLIIYLFAVIGTGQDPFHNRDFLFVFNMLLIGVMAIILFSVVETSGNSESKTGTWLLLGLAILTVIVNGIALSAILYRISEWGISPNRLAVLGGNILILTHLLIVTYRLFQATAEGMGKENVEKSIAKFLPVYSIWTIIVTFVFPVLFDFS